MKDWDRLLPEILSPIHFPKDPLHIARFGAKAILPATSFIHKFFRGPQAAGFFAGLSAHSMRPLSSLASSAFGLVLAGIGHSTGWPIAKGGSERIAGALSAHFISLGGKIEVNFPITSLGQLPSAHAIMLDTSPQQLLQIAGQRLSDIYQWQLKHFRYGMGIFKMDWALAEAVPFSAEVCRRACTIHIGNSFGEIAESESAASLGQLSAAPFVLLAQQSLFDPSRSPEGKHTLWGYCHSPLGSIDDRAGVIEKQIERFAPGFRERVLARHVMNAADLEAYNPNCPGGAIDGGEESLAQLFTRPALRFSPYRTSAKGIYLCSASTPPGSGAHGMCGHHAAIRVLKDIFNLKPQ
jgi:phytoene dehydrogenase-like protein